MRLGCDLGEVLDLIPSRLRGSWQLVAAGLGALQVVLVCVGAAIGLDSFHESHGSRWQLLGLIGLLLTGTATGACGVWLLVRISRHRELALEELREVNDDLSF